MTTRKFGSMQESGLYGALTVLETKAKRSGFDFKISNNQLKISYNGSEEDAYEIFTNLLAEFSELKEFRDRLIFVPKKYAEQNGVLDSINQLLDEHLLDILSETYSGKYPSRKQRTVILSNDLTALSSSLITQNS